MTEPWMETETDGVPVATHIGMKQKLKGKLSDKDDEISTLRKEVDALKAKPAPAAPVATPTERPKRADFEDEDGYFASVDRFEDKRAEDRQRRLDMQRKQDRGAQSLQSNVDAHYDRAGVLIEEAGINPEVYQTTDRTVRSAVDSVMPGMGDAVTDQLIANIGDGSEKVLYYVGNNPAALNKFKGLLAEDPSGLKAAVYLGSQKTRLTKPQAARSTAPAPSPRLSGDGGGLVTDEKSFKKYAEFHKSGSFSEAFKLKREAKKSGVDVSGW